MTGRGERRRARLGLTLRAAWSLAAVSVVALVAPPVWAVVAWLAVLIAAYVDSRGALVAPRMTRTVPIVMARGVRHRLTVGLERHAGGVLVRQPLPPDFTAEPSESSGGLTTEIVPLRRGRHELPGVALRVDGPLGLGRRYHRDAATISLRVYPDLPAAHRVARAVQVGRYRSEGRRRRGPMGLGTDFEAVREYRPDDDLRQVNWRATVRVGSPMSNTYRVEQDRDVVCCVDTGRLMAAAIDERLTRLDAALDAVVTVALVADVLGDRCGMVAFSDSIRSRLRPDRDGGRAVVDATLELEPELVESDYDIAFRTVGGGKRSLVIIFTDLLEPSAARPLVEAVPVLARRHVVLVASVSDPELEVLAAPTAPASGRARNDLRAWKRVVAQDVLAERAAVARALLHAGVSAVVEAPADQLGARCVDAYLRAKARARL